MKKLTMFLMIGVLVTSCSTAKKASEVSPVYIPSETYANLSCEELARAADKI